MLGTDDLRSSSVLRVINSVKRQGFTFIFRLGFAEVCKEQIPSGREEIPWSIMTAVLVLARFCAPSSELQIAESWYDKTALDDLLGGGRDKIIEDRLYRALDALLPHNDELGRA